MGLHPKFQQKNRHPRYTGHKPPRRLENHLKLSLMPNSDHVSTGIKPLCLNIFFNKNPSYRNQSIDTHCRSMNWFETTRVFTQRNFWTKIYDNKHSPWTKDIKRLHIRHLEDIHNV